MEFSMRPDRILVVDDDLSMREMLSILLRRFGYTVDVAASGEEALAVIESEWPDLVLTDLNMPGMHGIALLSEIKRLGANSERDVEVIVVTAYGSTRTAVDAMSKGAANYVLKPFNNDELRMVVRRALGRRALQVENRMLKAQLRDQYHFGNLIGASPAMNRIYEMIDRVKDTKINCLIVGESGTGKELVARAIHFSGSRAEGAFVPINCGAIPEALVESELFGHKKGSFTGAVKDKKGLIETSSGGTIFLDEVNSLPPSAQVKLLRVLQERRFTPVGGTREIEVDIRVVAASNADLELMVEEGQFREDLYYRLNVVQIVLPPVRDRAGDLPALIRHFVRRFGEEYDRGELAVSPDAMRALQAWHYPGNVRELSNIIERSVALSNGGLIMPLDLPEKLIDTGRAPMALTQEEFPDDGVNLDGMLGEVEKRWLLAALEEAQGNKTEAAGLLQMSFRSFRYRLAKLGMEDISTT
jgi:two-component system, NtrC family, response regulator PilR